jgi:hypothetical protein
MFSTIRGCTYWRKQTLTDGSRCFLVQGGMLGVGHSVIHRDGERVWWLGLTASPRYVPGLVADRILEEPTLTPRPTSEDLRA